MRPLDFIITGMPRSGTGYTSKVLNTLGLKCGHESYFSHNKQRFETDEPWEGVDVGDSSWLAGPFLHEMSEVTFVFYQTRDPFKILDSAFPGKGSLVGEARAKGPYARFVRRHLATGLPDTEEDRLLHWFLEWDTMCKAEARFEYPIENVNFAEVYALITGIDPKPEALQAAARVPTNTNNRGEPRRWAEHYIRDHEGEPLVEGFLQIANERATELRRTW